MTKAETILVKFYILSIITLIAMCLFSCTETKSIVTLNGSKSYDPDGKIVRYKWQQVAGNPIQLINADSIIAKAVIPERGVYVFELTGIDNGGAVGFKRVTKIIK